MDAHAIVAALRSRGAEIQLVGRRLGVSPRRALDDELRRAIRTYRDELFALVSSEGGRGVVSPLAKHLNTSTVPTLVDLAAEPVSEVRERLGAVLIHSRAFGEVWLALDPCMVDELAAEEESRSTPRPILRVEEVARFKGRPAGLVQAALDVLRVFPGTRVIQ